MPNDSASLGLLARLESFNRLVNRTELLIARNFLNDPTIHGFEDCEVLEDV